MGIDKPPFVHNCQFKITTAISAPRVANTKDLKWY